MQPVLRGGDDAGLVLAVERDAAGAAAAVGVAVAAVEQPHRRRAPTAAPPRRQPSRPRRRAARISATICAATWESGSASASIAAAELAGVGLVSAS